MSEQNDALVAAQPTGGSAETLRRLWNRWLDFVYGAEKCPYGMRRGKHEWFHLNCEGCRSDWLEEVEKAATESALLKARREREERVSQMVEALRRFNAERRGR